MGGTVMSPRTPASKGRAGGRGNGGRSGRAGRGSGGAAPGGRGAAQQHRQWLELVDTEGPFLSVPVLTGLYPQGIPGLSRECREALRAAKPAFDRAWDAWDVDRDSNSALVSYRRARDSWVGAVLTGVLGWGGSWTTVQDRPALEETHRVSSDGYPPVTATPTGALVHGEDVGALVLVTDPVDSLREVGRDGWATSPIDRMAAMLRAPGSTCSIGVVTDGRWWALVSAPRQGATASGVVDSQTWVEEPATRDAFFKLLGVRHLVGGAVAQRLPRLFADSVLKAEEITEALGAQVRRAVELVVTALSEAARNVSEREGGRGDDPLPVDARRVYEAVVTVMMRVVFLLFAEERGLLPAQSLYTGGYGLATVLDALEERARDEGEESMDGTSLIWHRLLATSRALYGGVNAEDMRIPAYGGSLFDPGRFPFLTATDAGGALLLTVSDRVMLHVLRSLQTARLKGQEARRLSFRDIDVEQIGYIYEGLLGYTCVRAEETVLGLRGKEGEEPEVPLSVLEGLAEAHSDDADLAKAIIDWLEKNQPGAKPSTRSALAKELGAGDAMPDAEAEGLLLAVTRDEGLRARLRPWIGAIRTDLRGRPVVVQREGLIVVETPSRKNAGAHYTPRLLAEDVVRYALEPLVHSPGPHETDASGQWRPISSTDILDLHVADIACGSGAFLVAAARFLARELVEAWTREGTLGQYADEPGGAQRHALRQVVARCLYGADINEMAVEMCKLSLWLVSLDKDKPFSFVDDKVFVGNSLLGLTDLCQLKVQHIDPAAAAERRLFELDRTGAYARALDVDAVVNRVVRRRRDLASEVDNADPARSTTTKRRLQRENEEDLEVLTRVANAIVAAGLDPMVKTKFGKRLNEAYGDLAVALGRAFPADGAGDDSMLEAVLERGLTPTVGTDYERWRCLHWPLAVPEVMERGGFDAIVGNPPFLGAKKLSRSMGKNLREWCVHVIANRVGNADIVAYFFLRAFSLINEHGTLGLIATNSVAQGDTCEVGLDQMVDSGFTITRAIQSRSWPSRSANLEFAAVWGTRDAVSSRTTMVCDGAPVSRISSLLEPASRAEGKPERFVENSGVAFQGCIVLGKGFVLEPEEAQEWIAEDSSNAEVLFPYLNGEDLNSRPDCSASRWVIDFNERSQGESQRYILPWRRALIEVRPERVVKDVKKYPRMVNEWWKYWNSRPAMRKAIANLDEVLVVARVSKTVMPTRIPTGSVMSEQIVVFATDSYAQQAILSSSVHQDWVITYGSTLETRVRYTPSDVFETFPRPEPTPELEAIGRTLDAERREIMLRRDLGLTRLYNLVNDPGLEASADPDVDRMRAIHVELDAVVAAAYGWEDLDLAHGFHTYQQMTRWTVAPVTRVEILDRLLEENHRRAAAAASGRSAPGGPGFQRTRGRKSAKAVQIPVQEATLDI